MDYKEITDRIEWNENRIKEVLVDFKKIKYVIQTFQSAISSDEPEILKMFDEKFRLKYALMLTNDNRKLAAEIMQMSERNLYRLMRKYNLI